MNTFLAILLVLCLFSFIRNNYTYKRMVEAINIISLYNHDMIHLGLYDETVGTYSKMKMDYNDYFFTISLWGKYSGIKPEYKETLKPYFGMEK